MYVHGLRVSLTAGKPNNSFKPTPCRGVGHVLYATLAHVRRPATGRLNSGVRPLTKAPNQPTKLQKLIAVYERFSREVESINDPWAQKLSKQCGAVRSAAELTLGKEAGATRSQLAAGLEQGLRDTPDFIALVASESRSQVAKAFHLAIQSEYPEFITRDTQRLDRIRLRGRIRTESEYYLVRHQIDVLEGGNDKALLHECYQLADSYGTKV